MINFKHAFFSFVALVLVYAVFSLVPVTLLLKLAVWLALLVCGLGQLALLGIAVTCPLNEMVRHVRGDHTHLDYIHARIMLGVGLGLEMLLALFVLANLTWPQVTFSNAGWAVILHIAVPLGYLFALSDLSTHRTRVLNLFPT